MAGSTEIRVPDMGDFKDVAIIDVLVKAGDTIEIDTPLITLETDKATMDVPSTAAGVIEKVHAVKGGKISPGDLVATVRAAAEAPKQQAAAPEKAKTEPTAAAAAVKPQPAKPATAAPGTEAPAKAPAANAQPAKPAAPAPAAKPASKAVASTEVRAPDMGGFKDVAVIDVLVKVGDAVEVNTPLATLETDKATMDVPSTVAGTIEKVHVTKGGKLSEGDLIVTVRSQGGGAEQPAAVSDADALTVEAPRPTSVDTITIEAQRPPISESDMLTVEAPKLDTTKAKPPAAESEAPRPASVIPDGRDDLPPIDEPGFSRAHAGPSVRKLAREMGVDLAKVTGTGLKGRISHDDVKAYVKRALSAPAPAVASGGGAAKALPAVPQVDFAKFGAIESKPLTRIQKISGPRLLASWLNIPHVTQFDEADITALEELRGKLKQKAAQKGIKLTPLAFIMRACVRALQEMPQFNASLDASGASLIYKKYFHIGFAADTPNGLVVPVLRDVDRCDIYEIARKLGELAEKARTGKLSPAEMQGGSFTISSLGGIGGTAFTPIINAPEVAILGVSRSSMKPVFENDAFVPRLMLPLSLSYDHRVIDGAAAARFTSFLATVLADPHALTEAVP